MDLVLVKHRHSSAVGQTVAGPTGCVYLVAPKTQLLHLKRGTHVAPEPGVHPEDADELLQFTGVYKRAKPSEARRHVPPPPKRAASVVKAEASSLHDKRLSLLFMLCEGRWCPPVEGATMEPIGGPQVRQAWGQLARVPGDKITAWHEAFRQGTKLPVEAKPSAVAKVDESEEVETVRAEGSLVDEDEIQHDDGAPAVYDRSSEVPTEPSDLTVTKWTELGLSLGMSAAQLKLSPKKTLAAAVLKFSVTSTVSPGGEE